MSDKKRAITIDDKENMTFTVNYYSEKSVLLHTEENEIRKYYSEKDLLLHTEEKEVRVFFLTLTPERVNRQIEHSIKLFAKNHITHNRFPKADFVSIVTAENKSKTVKYEWRIADIMETKPINNAKADTSTGA